MRIRIRQDELYGGLTTEADVISLVDLTDQLERMGLEVTDIEIKVQRRYIDDIQTTES